MTFIELEVTVDNNEQKRMLQSTNETSARVCHEEHNTTLQDGFFLFVYPCFSLALSLLTLTFLPTSLETTIKLLLLATHASLHFSILTLFSSIFFHSLLQILCSHCSILLLCRLALMKRHDETIVNEH